MATYGFESYLAGKHALGETADPVDDLRRGWDLHVEFGLSQPAFYHPVDALTPAEHALLAEWLDRVAR